MDLQVCVSRQNKPDKVYIMLQENVRQLHVAASVYILMQLVTIEFEHGPIQFYEYKQLHVVESGYIQIQQAWQQLQYLENRKSWMWLQVRIYRYSKPDKTYSWLQSNLTLFWNSFQNKKSSMCL